MTQKCSKRIKCQKMRNLPAVSLPEAAKILYLTTSTLRYHIIRKRLRAFKWAGKWYVYKIDVETFRQWAEMSFYKKK